MGSTKALVPVDGVPMAQRVATALVNGGCDGIALIGGAATEFQSMAIPFVADAHPHEGPLGGIITALVHFASASHVLVAACDLPMLDTATVQILIAAARARPDIAATVAQTDRIEPALVVWNRAAIDDLVKLFGDGERAVHRALDRLETQAVPVAAGPLANVNRPTDVPNSDATDQ